MIPHSDYPSLSNFLSGTFHQDWDETAETYQGVMDVELPTWGSVSVWRIESEISDVLASSVTDEDLTKWLEVIGCYIVLPMDGYTARSFLEMIAERIRVHHPQP